MDTIEFQADIEDDWKELRRRFREFNGDLVCTDAEYEHGRVRLIVLFQRRWGFECLVFDHRAELEAWLEHAEGVKAKAAEPAEAAHGTLGIE